MDAERLVRMANDIARFYEAEPDHQEAVGSVKTHLRRFWDPRMRREILQHLESGGSGLSELAREALELLRQAA